MKRKPNAQTVARVMNAAWETETANARESAIIGGIVHSLVHEGQFNETSVARHAADTMAEAYRAALQLPAVVLADGQAGGGVEWPKESPSLADRMFPAELRGYPTTKEIRALAHRFMERYNPPPAGVAG